MGCLRVKFIAKLSKIHLVFAQVHCSTHLAYLEKYCSLADSANNVLAAATSDWLWLYTGLLFDLIFCYIHLKVLVFIVSININWINGELFSPFKQCQLLCLSICFELHTVCNFQWILSSLGIHHRQKYLAVNFVIKNIKAAKYMYSVDDLVVVVWWWKSSADLPIITWLVAFIILLDSISVLASSRVS